MTVLVTGGAGYIGSHTCKKLAKAGFIPVTYDNLSTGHASFVKWGPLVVGDLLDKEKLIGTLRKYRPCAILHFAADALVIESMTNPGKYYRNNVVGTLSLLEAMQAEAISNLIFSSTCATYGNPVTTPISEEHPQMPTNTYGRTKWIAEQMMSDFDHAHGLKTIKLRYFNAAGADLDGEVGENRAYETHLIPLVLDTALQRRSEIVVYGTDHPTPDGTAIRDYVHVSDLADAHVLSLKHLLKTQKSDAFNLGSGNGTSVLEVIEAVQKQTKKNIAVRHAPKRVGEPALLTADNKKIQNVLGWSPKLSLSEIIQSAHFWRQKL